MATPGTSTLGSRPADCGPSPSARSRLPAPLGAAYAVGGVGGPLYPPSARLRAPLGRHRPQRALPGSSPATRWSRGCADTHLARSSTSSLRSGGADNSGAVWELEQSSALPHAVLPTVTHSGPTRWPVCHCILSPRCDTHATKPS